jgi:PAS domain S-box-containing protein
MQRTREVTIGTSLVGMLDDEAAERFNQTTQHIVTTKIPIEYDTAFRMNGELRQFHILRFPLLNATGHVESIGGIGLDVTEQRRAAATLRESEERYRSLFENSAVGIFQSTPSGQYNLVNPAYAQMLGYTIEELLTLDIAERLYWDSAEREQLRAQYEPLDVMEGVEMRWKKKNGEQIIVNVHAKTVRDAQGQVVRYEGLVLDVTERKRIETQLRESEERLRAERSLLRTVIDHLPAIIFVKNLEKQFAISNAAHVRWLGLTHEADVIGKTVHDFYPATQAQLFQETDQQVLETRQGQLEREYAVRNPAGQLHWHVTTKLPLTDSTHNIIGLVTISHDITDRKQAEEALRASEEKFNKAFQASPVSMIFARSSDGQWLEVNDTLVTLSGYTRKEMLGQNAAVALRMWGNPEDRSRYRELFAAQGFVHDFEIPFRKKSGEVGVGLLSAERIELAGESYGLISLQDITERKHAETALQESDQRYRGAIIAAGLVPYVIDYRPPRFTFMGEGILKLTGYSAEEYTPTLLKESVQEDYVWGTNAQLTPSEARQRFRSGQLLEWRSDMRIQTRSGESRWLSDASIPLLDEFGKAKGAIGILQDITERKHAEEKLQASLREKETLLKEVHHRVKNNMQVISSLLNLQAGQIADPQTRDVFRDSQNRVRAMALVHEKLYQSADLARIQFGEYIRHLTDFLFRAYSQQAQNISLQLDIADVTLGVDTAIPCGLLINELVSNALKHAFPQGRAGTLTVALHATSPQQCSLVVQDDGVGMPTAFDWQQTTSLGLQLVLSLVSQLAGEVQLTNQAGTTFTIQFAVSSVGA